MFSQKKKIRQELLGGRATGALGRQEEGDVVAFEGGANVLIGRIRLISKKRRENVRNGRGVVRGGDRRGRAACFRQRLIRASL